MDNSMFRLMDFMVLGCGIYLLYAYYLMKFKGEVKENLFLSAETKWAKCKDKKAYLAYMAPKTLIMGITTAVSGALGVINDYLNLLNWQVFLGVTVVFFAVVVWFGVIIKKSVKLFW